MYRKGNLRPLAKFDLGPCSEVPFTPDFGTLGELQAKYGNDINLMINKPQYRDLIGSNLREIEVASDYPDLSDEQMIASMPSREMDVNELAEYAKVQAADFKKQHGQTA